MSILTELAEKYSLKYSLKIAVISGCVLVAFAILYYIRLILLVGMGLSLVVLVLAIYAKFFMKKHLKKLENDFK